LTVDDAGEAEDLGERLKMTDEIEDPKRVVAVPAKRFFVGMLVKDIELVPAIIDLVDNSVDGAKGLREIPGPQRFAGLKIELTVSGTEFSIEDNCGGIDLNWAREYAFRFGRAEDIDGPLGEVGQFGVGMKRALFKLGNHFTVTSTTTRNAFTLPVNVTDWLAEKDPEWSFELSDVDDDVHIEEADTGTLIYVEGLHDTVAEEMATDGFVNRLRDELRLRQARVVSQGLEILVNGAPVGEFVPELLSGDDFVPISIEKQITIDGETLDMKLYAGLIRLRETDAELNDDEAEDFRQPPKAGWYLFCNDRLLLEADRTRLTGWGDAAAAYHPQYRQFRGYVLLEGHSSLMPWTTTKTAVDEDSAVFREVQTAMFDALQKTQAVMNRVKKERQSNPEGERPAFDAVRAAAAVPLSRLSPSERFVVPPPAPRTPASNVKWIRYSVSPDDFAQVAAELGVTAAVDVGRGTFGHYLETQVPR
jgi:hypothetical protein